jgi:hypothetical protein
LGFEDEDYAMTLPIILGVISALMLIVLGRTRGKRGELRIYAIGLTAAALIYVGFALFHAEWAALRVELLGLAIFGLLTVVSLRLFPRALAAGWVGHVIWDVLLHGNGLGKYAPEWYPIMCIGFDLFIAGYITALHWPDQALQPTTRRAGSG